MPNETFEETSMTIFCKTTNSVLGKCVCLLPNHTAIQLPINQSIDVVSRGMTFASAEERPLTTLNVLARIKTYTTVADEHSGELLRVPVRPACRLSPLAPLFIDLRNINFAFLLLGDCVDIAVCRWRRFVSAPSNHRLVFCLLMTSNAIFRLGRSAQAPRW